ncbi:MAG: DNA polymerase I [Microbacterium ginsengisoli]|uniref:DNA polymerase I n=1 Tax=Microbacterium TaxID=33882 RepID=UPI0006F2A682|nr:MULTISPECIES: DNA polymerase I [unclassified Microbacterium]MBN9197476.1 DNA polymerase I [Microbacterium ginsengisoli]KQR93153.1 DNA polymerase I [Microbacterium sp. Leaf351]KQS05453.1 DNA polymerase I [Microbacterium sp. Leaf347]ODU77116.1 MAG: DNA polymerase I [Microbacterium sp. SCN 71-21]OJU77379.1 MAG: DNA polymerase I [Microbacterium sp. 71-23]
MTDSAQPTLLVVDGHSLAFRAFYALPVDNFTTKDGQHTNGIYGFLSMFVNLLKAEKPTHLAVAFDTSRVSFRTREYAEYKANRSETPPEFAGQIPLLQDCLRAIGVTVLTKEDIEADDILATLATRGAEAGYKVLVCSGDRDTIQLVTDDVTLLYPSVQGVSQLKRYDPAAVEERYGVRPEQYPDIAALVGETSDNLPGVPKVGEKTAVKWLTQWGTLEALLENADKIGGVVGGNLREHLDDVKRNRALNRLLRDVELPVSPADLEIGATDLQEVRDIFARLEFRTLMPRLLEVIDAGDDQGESAPVTVAPVAVESTPADAATWLTGRTGDVGVVVTVEQGTPARLGFADATAAIELSWSDAAATAIGPWLASDAPKVLHDAKPQLKALRRAGADLRGIVFDAALAGWLIRPSFPDKTLGDLVERYLGEKLPEADPTQLVPETEGATPGQLAWFVARVGTAIRDDIPSPLARVLDEIELPTLDTLADMELAGVAVSHDHLSAFSTELATRADAIAADAFAAIGREVNLGSPKQLQEVLFDDLQLPKTRKTKTGYSTDAAVLADLQESNPHPFLDLLLQHREATKLRQIIESLDAGIQDDGRIHTTYVQTGSQTGRLSSTDPNLQNIPVRTEESRRIRAAFEVGAGFETLLTADYSQIEMRIMAHLSGDPGLIEAFRSGEDLHRFVGARVFGVDPAEVSPAMRTKVKAMSYGLVYGLSAFGLSKQLRIEQSEAKQLMTEYFARFGAVRDYLRSSVEQARIDGFTETIFGRRRPFPDLTSPNRVLRENAERAALNAPIQGSAADIMKLALFRIHDELRSEGLASRVLLQIHDELVVEVAPGEWDAAERIVRERMGDAADLSVPLDVQIGHGRDWNGAAH